MFVECGSGGAGPRREGESEQEDELRSIHSMTTEQWRAQYEADGAVDLWVEEEFNSGSRLTVRPVAFSPDTKS